MTNTLLITADQVREFIGVYDNSIEDNYLEVSIRNMQFLEMKNILGQTLFTSLITDLENNTLSGTSETLLNNYVLPSLSYYAASNVLYEISYKITRKGLLRQLDDSSETPSDAMISMRAKQYKDIATSYANDLIQYLNDNVDTYTEYPSDSGTPSKRSGSSIFTGYNKKVSRD